MPPKQPTTAAKAVQAVFTGLLAILLYVAAIQIPARVQAIQAVSAPNAQSGSLVVRVVDVNTLKPIEGAEVVVPETQQRYPTGTDGKTAPITVPILRDTRFDELTAKPWGEISLLVYKQGYLPYAVFYLQVLPGVQRNGPTIYMIPPKDAASKDAISIIEGPTDDWVSEIVRKYAPTQ